MTVNKPDIIPRHKWRKLIEGEKKTVVGKFKDFNKQDAVSENGSGGSGHRGSTGNHV